MDSQIKKVAKEIAKEIAERPIMNIDSVATMIEVRIKFSIRDFVNEYSTEAEGQYQKLRAEQNKHRIGTKEYKEVTHRLTAAKAKKATVNRALNSTRREDNFAKLKTWMIERYGKEVFEEFISENILDTPIFSTK